MPDAGERMNTQERNWNNGVGSFICVCVRQVTSVMSHSVQLYGPWPVRPLCPWDSPGKNPGVGFHTLLHGIFPTQ